MTHNKSIYALAVLVCLMDVLGAAGAQAQQYVYGSSSQAGQPYYPAPSNNYVSAAGNSQYQNPYQVPAASATSYQPVSVPGSQYQDTTYPAVAPAPAAASPFPSIPAGAPTPAVASAPAPQYQTAQAAATSGGIDQLPSYPYDPNLDSKQLPAYKPPTPEQKETDTSEPIYHPYMGLETRSGVDVGVQFLYYSYNESSAGVSEDGEMLGITARGTAALGKGFFTTADVRYMFGDANYDGTGTINDTGVDSWELRGLFGKDFMVSREYSLSPYVGLGYRTLFNDARGISSDGASGYRRFNTLYYIPIGVYPRTHIDSNARLAGTLEYDYVIHGQETSYFSDDNFGDPKLNNEQTSGYGIRGDISYETKTWSFGPFFTYWSIDQSNTKVFNSPGLLCGASLCTGTEPGNNTFEAGVQFKYHFL